MNDTVAPALSQWGTPLEWWVCANYPDPKTTRLTRWAWQFCRRNPDVRQFWQDVVLPYYDAATDIINEDAYRKAQEAKRDEWVRSNPPIGDYFEIVPLFVQMERRFGVWGDPRRSERHSGFIVPGANYYRPLPVDVVETMKNNPELRRTLSTKYPGDLLKLRGNEVAIIFDADWSIEPQLDQARHILSQFSNTRSVQPHRDLFPSYLQIIDGADMGVDVVGIAASLFPEIEDRHPEYRASRLVRDRLTAARKLRDYGYRRLAALDRNPTK